MSPRVNPQYKEKRRSAILAAAKRVFTEKGYHRARMQDILVEAGISRGALYAYFDNIEHVYQEVLKLEDELDIGPFENEDGLSCREQLFGWIRMQQRRIGSDDHAFLLSKTEYFISKSQEAGRPADPYIKQRYERLAASIEQCIQTGIDKKEFDPTAAPGAIALYVLSFLDGLLLDTFNLGTEATKADEQIDIFIVALSRILGSENQ